MVVRAGIWNVQLQEADRLVVEAIRADLSRGRSGDEPAPFYSNARIIHFALVSYAKGHGIDVRKAAEGVA